MLDGFRFLEQTQSVLNIDSSQGVKLKVQAKVKEAIAHKLSKTLPTMLNETADLKVGFTSVLVEVDVILVKEQAEWFFNFMEKHTQDPGPKGAEQRDENTRAVNARKTTPARGRN